MMQHSNILCRRILTLHFLNHMQQTTRSLAKIGFVINNLKQLFNRFFKLFSIDPIKNLQKIVLNQTIYLHGKFQNLSWNYSKSYLFDLTLHAI